MLRTPAPFPEVGSYGLREEGGYTHLIRIVEPERGGEVLVAFPLVAGAAGNKRLPIGALIDATALTPAEAAELRRLEKKILRYDQTGIRVRRKDREAADALRLRFIHNETLRTRIEQAERKGVIAHGTAHALKAMAA